MKVIGIEANEVDADHFRRTDKKIFVELSPGEYWQLMMLQGALDGKVPDDFGVCYGDPKDMAIAFYAIRAWTQAKFKITRLKGLIEELEDTLNDE